jgi:nucleoside phosphorylase
LPSNYPLNLITALPAEAKSLIKAFGLKRVQPNGRFPYYTTQDINLVVCGVGMSAMYSAVTFLQRLTPLDGQVGWLNIGICGHGSRSLGEALLVNRVYAPDDQSWSLRPPYPINLACSPIRCVTRPQVNYEPHMAYDMESAGFVTSLLHNAGIEHACILKIVSDTPSHGSEKITARGVHELVAQHIHLISELIHFLQHHGWQGLS